MPDVQPLSSLVAQRCNRERGCLRKLVAHKALHEQLRSCPGTPRATPLESNQLPSHPIDKSQYWFKASEEDTELALIMERLILDDLKEQERLNSSAA
jgi:hypothetical protein